MLSSDDLHGRLIRQFADEIEGLGKAVHAALARDVMVDHGQRSLDTQFDPPGHEKELSLDYAEDVAGGLRGLAFAIAARLRFELADWKAERPKPVLVAGAHGDDLRAKIEEVRGLAEHACDEIAVTQAELAEMRAARRRESAEGPGNG